MLLHHGRDQADNAVRLTTRGAAVAVKRKASAAAIAKAVRRILDEPAYQQSAQRLGETIRRDAASGALVAELERRLAGDWANVEAAAAYRHAREELEALLARWELLFDQTSA